MGNTKSNRFSLICILIGCLLVISSLGYLIYTMVYSKVSEADNHKIVSQAEALIPEPVDAFPEERGNNTMPSLEIEGVNVIGILEMPQYALKLPVQSGWDTKAVKGIPCRYIGSIYDSSLVIGATDSAGQIDFAEQVQISDAVYLTDMEGNRYTYLIAAIKHSAEFKVEKWQSDEWDMVVFVRSTLSGEYTVFCMQVK